MMAEKPKLNNKLLANSAKQYIESASYEEICDFVNSVSAWLRKKHAVVGFFGIYKRSPTKDFPANCWTCFNHSSKELHEMYQILGMLEDMKFNFLKELQGG